MTVKLILGDRLQKMKDIPDKSIDLVLTDPPYGIGLEYGAYQDTEENWFNLMENVLPEIIRVSKMAILPSCQINRLNWIYSKYPPDWLIAWYKGSPGTLSFVGFNDWEPHLVYGKSKGVQMHDYFQTVSSPTKGSYGHPCPKPIEWGKWLISRASKEGDTILDPFMGSGTTGVACVQLDRNFIGMEIDPKYFAIAERRIKEEENRLKLPF